MLLTLCLYLSGRLTLCLCLHCSGALSLNFSRFGSNAVSFSLLGFSDPAGFFFGGEALCFCLGFGFNPLGFVFRGLTFSLDCGKLFVSILDDGGGSPAPMQEHGAVGVGNNSPSQGTRGLGTGFELAQKLFHECSRRQNSSSSRGGGSGGGTVRLIHCLLRRVFKSSDLSGHGAFDVFREKSCLTFLRFGVCRINRRPELRVLSVRDGDSESLAGYLGVDQTVLGIIDSGQRAPVAVLPLDVEREGDLAAFRQRVGQELGGLRAEAFDRLVRILGLGRVDVQETNGYVLVLEVDDQCVSVDHADNPRFVFVGCVGDDHGGSRDSYGSHSGNGRFFRGDHSWTSDACAAKTGRRRIIASVSAERLALQMVRYKIPPCC